MFARSSFVVIAFGLPVIFGAERADAETVPVTCTIRPDAISASVTVTNTLKTDASCLASCSFATEVNNDSPQIVCSGPVPAGREEELCVLHSGQNKLAKFLLGHADCQKF